MKNNELLKKVCRYLNPYPQNLCLSLRPNPTGSTNRNFNTYPRITGTIHGLKSLNTWKNPLTGPIPMTKKHSKNNYSDNTMKTIAYIMSTYVIGTHDLDIRDILKSYIIARYYGWEPKEEDLEEIISHTPYFNIHVDDAIYEVLTMPREK